MTTEPLPICRRNEAAVEDRSRAATQATDGDPEGPTTGRLRGWPPDLGLAACVVIAAIAWALEAVVRGLGIAAISAVFLAILLGLVLQALSPGAGWGPGAQFASTKILKAGIVLLGLRFNLAALSVVGRLGTLAILAVLMAAALIALVVKRWSILPPRLAVLIAAGTAICGNSAIAAVAPLLGAKEEEVSYASGVITVFGMALVLGLPLVGHTLGLSDQQFGILAGAGVHDSGQAVATGFIYSESAGGIATVTKLARTTALIPLLAVLSLQGSRHGGRSVKTASLVPWFAIGFVALSAVRTLVEAVIGTPLIWQQLLSVAASAATASILVAMAGMGLATNLNDLREIGPRPLLVGLAASIAVTGAAATVAMNLA